MCQLLFLHILGRFHIGHQTLHTTQRSGGCAFCKICKIGIRYPSILHTYRQLQLLQYYSQLPLSTVQPMRRCEMACALDVQARACECATHLQQAEPFQGKEITPERDSISDTMQGVSWLHHCFQMRLPLFLQVAKYCHQQELFRPLLCSYPKVAMPSDSLEPRHR